MNVTTKQKHLQWAGADTVLLAKKYGTPLYVYDVGLIRKRIREFTKTFLRLGIKGQVAYASKAFSCMAMVQLAQAESMLLDVVSGGELYTALKAGFPAERIHFHGNNKSRNEIEMALVAGVGCIVIDNFDEIEIIKQLCGEYNKTIAVLLRVSPGVEAHTHDYIITGQLDSKFGFGLTNGQTEEALKLVLENDCFNCLGLHCHIGSQIFETTAFILAAKRIFEQLLVWKNSLNYFPTVLNLGGGFGIRYTDEDKPLPLSEYVEQIVANISRLAADKNVTLPEIWLEPGRSIVGDAGITLYEIGTNKKIPEVRNYLSVDGGMTDNLRPALYGAKYDAVIANRPNDIKDEVYTIAGKCCETGDMLISNLKLPKVLPNEFLAVFATGAYGYSMASNYNRLPRPAVVFVENGTDQLVIKRESYEDLTRNDLLLK